MMIGFFLEDKDMVKKEIIGFLESVTDIKNIRANRKFKKINAQNVGSLADQIKEDTI